MKRAYSDPKDLRAYQNRKLRSILLNAYSFSPFYHRKFDEAKIDPASIRTIEDLSKMPIIRKEELKKNPEDVISTRFDKSDLIIQRTSGSTGKPLYIYWTRSESEYRKSKHLRAQIALGQKPWHEWVLITSPLHFADTTRLQRILRFYAMTPLSVFTDTGELVSKIEKLKPDVLDGYANSIFLIAKELEKKDRKSIRPKFLVSGAELIPKPSRKFVEDIFDAPFYDQYACVELERIAWQCQVKDEYHIDADSLIVQFVDKNGEEVSPGEEGEIVCTSLFNYAMPFIRYALDDLGIPSETDACSCGRTLPLMKVVEGRKFSLLSLPDGRVIAPIAFMLAVWTFRLYGCIDLFRIVQKRKDLIVFKFKLKECGVKEEVIETEFKSHLREVLHMPEDQIILDIEFTRDMPLDKNGKFSIVVSELNQQSMIS